MKKFNIADKFYERPILIPNHEHPLIHCFHPEGFTCNNEPEHEILKKKGKIKIKQDPDKTSPSFFCSFCNYDICDDCFEQLELYKIVFYDPKKIKNKNLKPPDESFRGLGWKKFKCHIHEMPLIMKGDNQLNWHWKCEECHTQYFTDNFKDQLQQDKLYYCTLCGYSLCPGCADRNEED